MCVHYMGPTLHVGGTRGPFQRNQTKSPVAELLSVLSKSRTDSFATGLQKLVIKVRGGVTFYTSFEVQPVTAIMLKESVPSAQKK